jgi:CRISPR-associated protein Csm4
LETYEITIKPLTGFGTPLKGDTLFGHLCWQAAYDEGLFGLSIDKLLSDYAKNPFMVVSSAYFKLNNGYALKRPDMPLDMLFRFEGQNKSDIIRNRKEFKKKRWMLVRNNHRITSFKADGIYFSDEQLLKELSETEDTETQRQMRKRDLKSFILDYSQPHNSINRLTGTTGEEQFAPFTVDQIVYIPDTDLIVFVGLREDVKIEQVVKALKQVGDFGFGKDASTGLGRFKVIGYKEIDLFAMGSESPDACFTLAPCVPEKDMFSKMFFSPFTRFGRHGDVLAKSGKPFKNPVIMADEGAVFIFKDKAPVDKPYIGTAVDGISKAEPNAVTQGYSLYIPVKVEA